MTISVRDPNWKLAPFNITPGQIVRFKARAYGGNGANPTTRVTWNSSGGEATPDGIGSKCCGGCNHDTNIDHMKLIGKIAGMAQAFEIGASRTIKTYYGGSLELTQNDTCTSDNAGFYEVEITVIG